MGATAGLTQSVAATVTSAGQTVNSFLAQRKQAAAIRAQGDYEGKAYDVNAKLASQQAADALTRGQTREQQQRLDTRHVEGYQRAEGAAGGVDINSGSSEDVQQSTEKIGELDAMTIRNNAAREAWGYNVEANQYSQKAELARLGSKNQADAIDQGSWDTLLTGAVKTYGLWSNRPKKPSTDTPSWGDLGQKIKVGRK
jgi:hypothetical protein